MELDEFLSRLDGVKKMPSGFAARCPAHDDHVASLAVNPGKNGGIVAMCHANCPTESVVAAMGLEMGDLMGLPHVTDRYLYTTDSGLVLWEVERWANPKTFRCVPGLPPPADRVLYRGDALAWARERGAPVYICEGEKDANRLAERGLVSTCNVGGAGAWLPHYAAQVEGCHVMVIADNDKTGREHARAVADSCRTTAASVVTVLPRYGKDLSELLDLGWGLDALDPLPADDDLGMVTADNVITKPIEWAWDGYIPFGMVTIIEGDPGDGKSILTTDLAARWTSGAPMPDDTRHGGPWPVVMVTAEDDAGYTIAPRLRAGGADLRLVHLLDHGAEVDRPFDISQDTPALRRRVIEIGAKVVTLDPLMAMIGEGTDSHNDASVRRSLYPLFALARDTGSAVVVVRHLNKGSGGKAIYRGGGSIGFAGAARAVYAVGRDPEDPARRVLAPTKINIAAPPPALAYTVEQGAKGPFLEWRGQVDANAQDILDGVLRSDEVDILYFLNTVVENGEPMAWKDIVKKGRDEGYTPKQLEIRRGRSRLVKIVGHEGRRSTRWGYLEHAIAAGAISPPERAESPSPAKTPFGVTEKSGEWENGPPAQDHGPAHVPAVPGLQNGVLGGDGKPAGEMADPDDEDAKIEELESRPLQCEICETKEECHRYESPWWTVRCVLHNPFSYKATA